MSTYQLPVEPHHAAGAPTTRLGRWAVGSAVVSLVALGMFALVANFGPDDPAIWSFWGVVGLSIFLWPPFALVAAILGVVAMIRGERALLIYLAYAPLLITLLIPFIFPSV